MVAFLQIIISLLGIVLLSYIIKENVKKGQYVCYITLFSFMTIVDVFLPAMIGGVTGLYQRFPYFTISNQIYYLNF